MFLHHPKASIFDAAFGPAIGSCDPDRAFLRLRSGAPKNIYIYDSIYISIPYTGDPPLLRNPTRLIFDV